MQAVFIKSEGKDVWIGDVIEFYSETRYSINGAYEVKLIKIRTPKGQPILSDFRNKESIFFLKDV